MDDLGQELTTMNLGVSSRNQCYCRFRPQTFRHLHVCSYETSPSEVKAQILPVSTDRLYLAIVLSCHLLVKYPILIPSISHAFLGIYKII